MFRRNFSNPRGLKKGSSKTEKKDRQPYNVIAIGSQDRTITVWTTSSSRPLFIAKQFFSQSIVDLTWSPDGYSLFACSLDGTIATFHFDVNEIGKRLTDAQLEKLKKKRYSDVKARQGDLAEIAAQLLLESAKQTPIEKSNTVVPMSLSSPKPCTDLAVKSKTKTNHTNVNDGDKIDDAIIDGSHKVGSTRMSSPIKQKEYIGPDGRKRIIPEAIGVTAHQESTSIGEAVLDLSMKSLDRNNNDKGVLYDGSIRVIEKVPSSMGKEGNNNVEQINYIAPGNILSIRVFDKKQGDDTVPFCLEARPHADDTEVYCTKGSENLWSDKISGKVTVLAGNSNFWAVGSEDGSLQVYTKCGERAMPTMMVGSAAVFIDCDELWKLLLVTRKGSLYVWDVFNRKCLLHDSLVSLITKDNAKDTGMIKVISAKLSKSGSPLVVLATREAYLFDMSLMCWLRVAGECFASSWTLGSAHDGELAALQVDVRKFLARKPGSSRVTDDGVQTRAQLEAQLASSLALMSPNEYRQCLISYIRFLASEADESRLREVCENFLGPPIGIGEPGSDLKTPAWDPFVLGMNKHKLLREDILPAMASDRKVQRLLNEFIDLLSEYETAETNIEHSSPVLQSADEGNPESTPAIDAVDDHRSNGSGPLITDPMDTAEGF